MKKVYFVFLIIFLISCNKNRDGINFSREIDFRNYIDSSKNLNYNLLKRKDFAENAYQYIIQNNQKQILLSKIDELADVFYSLNNFKKSKELFKIILKKAKNQKNDLLIAESLYNIAYCEMSIFSNDSSYYYFSKAEKYYIKAKKLDNIANIKINKANILWYKNDFTGAEKLGIVALKNALKDKDYLTIYSCYITIGNSLIGMNNKAKALEYYNKALNIVNKLEKNTQVTYKTSTINYIALIYQKQNQHQKAISILENEINEKELRKLDIKLYCYQKNTKNYSKFKLGDKSSVYNFLETLKIGDSLKFAPVQITSKTYLGEYYLAQKDTIKANLYFKDAQKQAHKNNIFEDELKILQLLAKANPNDKSFYSNRYIALNDSLQTVERATRDKFARIEFETDEITAEKNTLNIEKNQVSMQRYLIAGISLLSLLIVFLWYRNKLQKAKTRELLLQQEQQKANEEIYQLMLDQQQKIEEGKNIEKQRISQELHDGVMGRLSAIRMNLFVLNKKTDPETIAKCLEYIKEIQNIEKEIRTISHDLNNNMFSDNIHFESIVKNLFTSIQNHSDIEFLLKVDEKINWETLPNSTKISIYRIIQEALQNIEKYARASHVAIQMEQQDNCIEIEIKDDGIGFKINTKNNGIGITNMQARMQELHGDFKIASQPNKGTKINLTIPI